MPATAKLESVDLATQINDAVKAQVQAEIGPAIQAAVEGVLKSLGIEAMGDDPIEPEEEEATPADGEDTEGEEDEEDAEMGAKTKTKQTAKTEREIALEARIAQLELQRVEDKKAAFDAAFPEGAVIKCTAATLPILKELYLTDLESFKVLEDAMELPSEPVKVEAGEGVKRAEPAHRPFARLGGISPSAPSGDASTLGGIVDVSDLSGIEDKKARLAALKERTKGLIVQKGGKVTRRRN